MTVTQSAPLPNGWPVEPGVPLNPMQNGAHQITHAPDASNHLGPWVLLWCGPERLWTDLFGNQEPPEVMAQHRYVGPMLAPEAHPEAAPQECGECGRNGDDFATCPRPADVCPAKPFPQTTQPGAQAPVAGLPLAQEPKYTTDGQAIINRASGEPIPADEPVFVFRARDIHAREALEAYACVLTPGAHRDAVVSRVADFAAFSYAHPDRMKEPDTANVGMRSP